MSLENAKGPEKRKNRHIEIYGMEQLLGYFSELGLDSTVLRHSPEDVCHKAMEVLNKLGIEFNQLILDKHGWKIFNQERKIFLLALADEWLSAASLLEMESLMEIAKLFAVSYDKNSRLISISEFVQRFSRIDTEDANDGMIREKNRMARFDPEKKLVGALKKLENQQESLLPQEISAMEIDQDASQKLTQDIGLPTCTLIDRENEQMQLLAPDKQQQTVSVVICNMSLSEFQKKYEANGFHRADYRNNRTTIFLPRDYQARTLRHEYIHTQSAFGGAGMRNISQSDPQLNFGLNEGLTEALNRTPETYVFERRVIEALCEKDPNLRQTLYDAYFNSMHRESAYKKIIELIGFKGFLAIARMHGGFERKLYMGPLTRKVMIPCQKALEIITQK
ncbi:MAG: hypothetical protein HYV32_05310 [Candidatus Kerfeldbacteria bacterium]|nr:hypothetical protein [Candidatus Kerfeldbacteria bacterium]